MVFAFIVPVLFTGSAIAVTILETSPANNEEDVAVDTSVTATFENGMESIDESKFYVVRYSTEPFAPAEKISGTATYADKKATWTPTQNLELDVEYYGTIAGGVSGVKESSGSTLDFDYKWKFNTGIRQVIQPADPAIEKTSSGNGDVSITFAEDMKPETINGDTFYIMTYPQDDPFAPGERIPKEDVEVTYSDKTATLKLKEGAFDPDTDYYVTLAASGVKDASGGSPLTLDYKWKFTTSSTTELTASINSPDSNAVINEGDTFDFQGTVENGVLPLDYSWDFGGGAANSDAEAPQGIVFEDEGDYTVTFTVTDAEDKKSSATVTVKVISGGDLEISMTPSEDLTIAKGSSVDFQGTVTAGNAPFTYSWDFGGGADNSGMEDPGNVTFDTGGDYTVTFTVTDAEDKKSSATVTVTVIPGGELEISITPSEDLTIAKGSSVDFQGTVTVGNAPLTYSWNFGDDAIEDSDLKDPGSVAFETEGTYTATFKVTDDNSNEKSASVTIKVVNSVEKGDIDGKGSVNLADAILALQICAGITPDTTVNKEAAVNNDKIGIEDAVYILMEIVNIDT